MHDLPLALGDAQTSLEVDPEHVRTVLHPERPERGPDRRRLTLIARRKRFAPRPGLTRSVAARQLLPSSDSDRR